MIATLSASTPWGQNMNIYMASEPVQYMINIRESDTLLE